MMSSLVALWALVAAAFTVTAVIRVKRTQTTVQSEPPKAARRPVTHRVLLVRPVDLPYVHEVTALQAPFSLEGVTQVIASPTEISGAGRWLFSDPTTANRKVGHVLNALHSVPDHDLVICIDADVIVDESLVHALINAITSGAAVASAAPRPDIAPGLVAHAVRGLWVQSHHSFVALDAMQAGAKTICGKALALSPLALDAFRGLGNVAGEDLELSTLMFMARQRVVLVDAQARVIQSATLSLREVNARFTRWMQVLRVHRPRLFPSVPLFFAPTPVLLVLTVAVNSLQAWGALGVLLASRVALALILERRLTVDWLLAEPVLLWCWLRSLVAGRTLVWRGRHYHLTPGGHLSRLTEERPA